MASYTEIANLAATEIGTEARITDPNEDKVLARAVKAVWDSQRQAAIREGSWNFAAKRAELAALAGSALEGVVSYPYAYAFQLPSDSLRLVEVLNDEVRRDYQIEGDRILCDHGGPVFIRYLRDVTEPGEFDAAFADALAKRIAWTIGHKIAGSTFDSAAAERKYWAAIGPAKRVDAQENPPIEQEESSWIEARWGSAAADPLRMG